MSAKTRGHGGRGKKFGLKGKNKSKGTNAAAIRALLRKQKPQKGK